MTFREEREASEKKKAAAFAYLKKNLGEIPYGISSAAGEVAGGVKKAAEAMAKKRGTWTETSDYEANRLQRRALIEAKDEAEKQFPNPKQAEARKDFINNYLKKNVGDKAWAMAALDNESELPSWAYQSETAVPQFKARDNDYSPFETYSGTGLLSATRDTLDLETDILRNEKRFLKEYEPQVKKYGKDVSTYAANVAGMTPKIAGLQSDFAGIQSGVDQLQASQQQRNADLAAIRKQNEEQLGRLNALNRHPWESEGASLTVDSGFSKLPLETQIARAGQPLTPAQNAAAEASGRAKIEAEFPTSKPKYIAPVRTQESLEVSRQERPVYDYAEYYKRQATAKSGNSGRSISDEPSDILVN
jgi:hypothetical protein